MKIPQYLPNISHVYTGLGYLWTSVRLATLVRMCCNYPRSQVVSSVAPFVVHVKRHAIPARTYGERLPSL